MSRYERLIQRILRGQSDADIRKINLQSDDGNAKPYQVRQVRRLIHKYKLGNDE